MREPTFFILLSLAAGPRHGYAIMKDVAGLSRKRVLLSTSTLYTALRRMLEDGWIQRDGEAGTGDGGRERKAYRLTDVGRRVLQAEVQRLEDLVGVARRVVAGGNA